MRLGLPRRSATRDTRAGRARARRLTRFGIVLGVALAIAAVGAGAYAMGKTRAKSGSDAGEARESAYRLAFDLAQRTGYIQNRSEGFRDGQKQGYEAGRNAGERGAKLAISQFRALPKPSKTPQLQSPPQTVWAVGDGADGGSAASAVARMVSGGTMDHFIYLGDVYQEGTPSEFVHNYDPSFGAFASITEPTPGNHDSPNIRSGYDYYWQKVKGKPQPHYYDWTAGGWQFFSLDSEESSGPQVSFVKKTIASTPQYGTCRIGYWHRPLMSAGAVHGDNPDVAPLWNSLAGDASIVLNGHEHDMQRFAPRDGITEFVAGAGGHERYPVGSHSGLAFGNDSDYGALRLILQPGVARYAFMSSSGKVLDSGSVHCKRG